MTTRILALATIIFGVTSPAMLHARSNTVDTGLSISYDYDDRQYDSIDVDVDEEPSDVSSDDDDYRNFLITPMIHLISTSQKDQFELRFSPSFNYDTIDSETDWDNNLLISADRAINKTWRLMGSNTLIRTDYHETSPGATTETETETDSTQTTSPELSADFGRTRYWSNTLTLDSEHSYGQASLVNLGFDYIILRNDESDLRSYDDYDRYVGSITNEHRFNQKWAVITDLSAVRGEFETTGPEELLTAEDDISDDLMEYYLVTTLENNLTRQTTISAAYNYTGWRYDESLQSDGDIHELQFIWAHIFSRQTAVTLGAGPSYEKSENRDSNFGGNALAELEYQNQHSTVTLGVEKRYGVDNFSGTGERGYIDYWDSYFLLTHQLTSSLTLDGQVRYRYEDREESTTDLLLTEVDSTSTTDEYNTKEFVSGIELRYNFLRYYTASIEYTFTTLDSDRIGDSYDDHRIVASLSWEQNWLRW